MNCRIIEPKIRSSALRDESGIALVMVLLVAVLMFGFAFALSTNSMFEADIAANHERETSSFYAAQTGLERAIYTFQNSYVVNTIPADGAMIFNQVGVQSPSGNPPCDYTVTVNSVNAPAGAPYFPFPILYTITSTGRSVPANENIQPSITVLTQTVSVSPQTLANYTLFYDQFADVVSFQSTFVLNGRLAINATGSTRFSSGTTINGDLYCAGTIARTGGYSVPTVSGTISENKGRIDFPTTINPFSAGASTNYSFTGTTRLLFNADGTVTIHNNGLSGSPQTVALPSNGIIAVNGDAVVEGTIHGRCTITSTDDILINGNVRYADTSPGSTDALATVANGDILLNKQMYTGVTGSTLRDFEAHWANAYVADSITGGTWSGTAPTDVYIDATLVSLNGSSPTVVAYSSRPPGNLYIYGNSIAKKASVTVSMNANQTAPAHGLNEIYNENRKLYLSPPPGFPALTTLTPTFQTFREIRSPIR
jgi:Tfp pilus assembly protein PilX